MRNPIGWYFFDGFLFEQFQTRTHAFYIYYVGNQTVLGTYEIGRDNLWFDESRFATIPDVVRWEVRKCCDLITHIKKAEKTRL